MRHRVFCFAGIASLALLAGCFRATVYTGLPGAGVTISKPWAHGFLFGLVAPSAIEPASKCRNACQLKHRSEHAATLAAGIYHR
jgi:hypothetical protein